jgi:hypothetical protein
MKTIKVTSTAKEAVKRLFTNIYGFSPITIYNNGNFYWADQVGFSLIGNLIIKNELYNGN